LPVDCQMAAYQIRQCTAPACRFRFPWTAHDPPGLRCPRCGAGVTIVLVQIRADEPPTAQSRPVEPPLHLLLDNVRSIFNVGSIFRSADGVGVGHLYLCGITPTPAHPKLAKTALGAEHSIPWSQHTNALDLAQALQTQGHHLWALEETATAERLFAQLIFLPAHPVTLIVGNEITGVDPALLALCERVLTIPMGGQKRSLNVATAAGIAMYALRYGSGCQPT